MFNLRKHKDPKHPTEGGHFFGDMTPFEDFERFMTEWEDKMRDRGWLRLFPWSEGKTTLPFEGRFPRVDVLDRDDSILVKAELPGVEKKDLDISLTDHSLTLKAERREEEKQETDEYFRHEIGYGSFARTIALPENVDVNKAKASFKDGVLEMTLPKTEKTNRKKLEVE